MEIVLITGSQSSGKSKLLSIITDSLLSNGFNIDGILSHSELDASGAKTAFKASRISDKSEKLLCSKSVVSEIRTKHFYFNSEAFSLGDDFINRRIDLPDVFVLDEIGIIEAKEMGWSELIKFLLKERMYLVFCVRKNILSQIIDLYSIPHHKIHDIDAHSDLEGIKNDVIDYFINSKADK